MYILQEIKEKLGKTRKNTAILTEIDHYKKVRMFYKNQTLSKKHGRSEKESTIIKIRKF